MAVDKIAVAGLVAGIVGGVAGIVGAIAAVVAAVYARGSATQAGLDLVEQNTAKASKEIEAVRTHIAQVDDHLRIQNNRESYDIAARATSMSVAAEGWHDEPQHLLFTVRTPGVAITHIDLVNRNELLSGTVPVTKAGEATFSATVTPEMYGRWRKTGDILPPGEQMIVYIRAGLLLDGAKRHKLFAVFSAESIRSRPGTNTIYYKTWGQV